MYKKLYDYLPRNEILKKITVPRSDAACIIVPPNKEGIGFVCKSFGKGLRNRDLDQERFQETVFEANKLAGLAYKEKIKIESRNPMFYEKNVIYLSFIFITLANLIYCYFAYTNKNQPDLHFLAYILSFASIFLILLAISFALLKKPRVYDFEKALTYRFKKYLRKENEQYYYSKRCTWGIGYKCFWLELHGNLVRL